LVIRVGRRKLRKRSTDLDLSQHLVRLRELLPTDGAPEGGDHSSLGCGERFKGGFDPQSLFRLPAPLEIEVGSGKGLFLLNAALAQPERNFLGIELAENYAEFSAARLARQNAPNAVMISGDALRCFHELLPEASAAAVHVYFPDPWWKKRHHKRRVMTLEFVRDIERVLAPGGVLHFWTDVEEYFQGTLALIAAETRLEGPLPVEEKSPAHDLDYRTNFERRKRQDGLPIYRADFRETKRQRA
jgi:tRNA (guanine-N7-)-methyltransferase